MPGVVAGDGAVVDAAASSYRLLRAEAVLQTADAGEYGLIVAQRVEPSCEIAAVEPMVRQHAAIFACPPPTLLLDAGFASNALWSRLVETGIDPLCPSGRITDQGDWQKRSSRPGKFAKGVFRYVPEHDVY